MHLIGTILIILSFVNMLFCKLQSLNKYEFLIPMIY